MLLEALGKGMEDIFLSKSSIVTNASFISFFILFIGAVFVYQLFKSNIFSAIVSMLLLAIIIVAAFYYKQENLNKRWYKAKVEEHKIFMTLANDKNMVLSCTDIDSIKPRFEKTDCFIVIRARNKAYSSGSVRKLECRNIAKELTKKLNCDNA